MPHGKPFVDFHAPLPPGITLKHVRGAKVPPGRATSATQQTIDLTPNTALVQDQNAFWSKDEQNIIFQSNRADIAGATAGTLFHIYQMRPDGSVLAALTGPLATVVVGGATSQTEPAFNAGASAFVYIDTDPNSGSVDLMEYSVSAQTTRSLVKNNPNGFAFTGLNHPEYGFALGGNVGVVFAGQLGAGQPFHLFSVDTQSGQVLQLTTGIADDRDPTLSPDVNAPVIAFDSNRSNSAGSAVKGNRDVWVIGINIPPSATQVTNFSSGGTASDNIQPAWSTNKIDQPTGTQHIVNGQQLIAFASTRTSPNNTGPATAINPNHTHDIYWLRVKIVPDVNNPGSFTVQNPEDPNSNPAYGLPTSDPNHVYDDLHPTWPQFISTYRVAYDSDRTFVNVAVNPPNSGPAGQPRDIFSSTLIDLNAPTLIRYDDTTGEVVHVVPRLAAPGSTVTISVKLADLETGIRDVWVQIKNPNSKYQSADHKEHKVYTQYFLSPDNANVVPTPVEYESQRIYIGDGTGTGVPNSYANPKYNSSIDDFFAFSGAAHPPDQAWLPMKFVSRDPATGIATYSAQWTTDVNPTDYYIDVIAYDNALNPFTTGSQDKGNNWNIYDNVWGFSTQTFIPGSHGILFVSDYAAGQKFFDSRFNLFLLSNVFNTFWGTESWMTDIDVDLLPSTYFPKTGGQGGTLVVVDNALGVKSYGASDQDDGFTFGQYDPSVIDGTQVAHNDGGLVDVPNTQQYDLWRILCRGPVPDVVLQQYTPHKEQQPPDTSSGEVTPRTVVVANKCVIWHAPYSGDLFIGPGTISDPAVQTQLHAFLAAGGRLFVNGQDVGFALTIDGTAPNLFFTNDLRAQYVNDQVPGFTTIAVGGGIFPAFVPINGAFAMQTTGNPDPITFDPWRNPADTFPIEPPHIYYGPPFPPGYKDNPSLDGNFFTSGTSPTVIYDMASFGVVYPDEVTPLAGVTSDMRYANGNTFLQHYVDGSTGQKLIYCAGGLEGLAPLAFTPPNTQRILALKNRRTLLLHNSVCWLRTGVIFGTVTDTSGAGIKNVLVRLTNRNDAKGNPVYAYTALTKADGTYVINGVEPEQYQVTGSKPGFTFQHRTGQSVHGGYRAEMSFRLSAAQNAIIKGQITRTDGKTIIVGATVTAKGTDPNNPITLTGTSDANGNYEIDNVPAEATYTLTASATGFGASIPVSYPVPNPNDPIAAQRDTLVQPAKTYVGFNFQLKAIPGSVTGFVYQKNADGSQGPAIPNATVTATFGATTTTVTAITDANGQYSFDAKNSPSNGLDPGIWSLVAVAPGFAPNNPGVSVTVISAQTVTAAPILLSTVPPGSISGLVTRTSDNAALPGVLIQLTSPSGTVVTSTTTTSAQTVNGYTFNYKITGVPAGVTYTVTASKDGFTPSPASQPAAVTSGTETQNINFAMAPLHTFSGQLTMVSAPYEYGNTPGNVKDLLSIPASDTTLLFASWDLGKYSFFPQPPADTFHLGRGYFLAYPTNLPLSVQGTAAPNGPFDINLNPGWNIIGDPFPFDIDWTKTQIVDGGVVKSLDQAIASGAVGASLYTFVSGTYVLDFKLSPWQGHWVLAYRAVTLHIDPATSRRAPVVGGPTRSAVLSGKTRSAVLRGGDGWSVNLQVGVGNVRDEASYLGVSSRAVDTFDGFKSEKPPVIALPNNTPYVYMAFDHKDWGSRSGGYGVDVRSASTPTQTWEFTVQTNQRNRTATLSWPNSAIVSRAATLLLTDTVTNKTVDLRSSSSYSWATGDTAAPRRFRIDATRTTMGSALIITGLTTRPAGNNRSQAMGITYNLSTAANVEVRILKTSGSQVRRLTAGATRAAGVNELSWDQRNDQGAPVPNGAYLIEVKAQSLDGRSTTRQVTTILIVR